MAHRMAELMDRAESATSDGERETARADATELVLRIWKHRSSWPNGWPPKASAAVLSMGDQSPHARREPTGSRWLDSLDSLERLQSRERKIWKDLGLLDFDVESERRAAEALSAEGDEEEAERNTGCDQAPRFCARRDAAVLGGSECYPVAFRSGTGRTRQTQRR